MARPDFVDSLTEDDVRQVVYTAADKPYMKTYLKFLGVLEEVGKFIVEPTLDYVAQKVQDNLLLYGITSERSRNSPSRDKGLLFHTHAKDEKNALIDVELSTIGEDFIILTTRGDEIKQVFSAGIIKDLRDYELKVLEQRRANDCV